MIKKFILILLILLPIFIQAQFTDIINSNSPGFSQSPYSVGTKVYQFESSLFYRQIESTPIFSNPRSIGLNLDFRTSFFFERLELNLSTSLQQDKTAFKNVFETSETQIGLGRLTLGAKYLIYEAKYTDKSKEVRSWKKRHSFDTKRLIPNIGVFAGVNFGSILNTPYQRGGITPKVGLLLQNEFTFQFNLISNVYYNYIGSDAPEWSYIITGTYNFNDQWSAFAEHQAKFNKYENKSNLGGGIAYLFNENMQVNASARATFQEDEIGFYSSVGLSYRINNHEDSFIDLSESEGKTGPKMKKETYKKGFFGRLFDKIKNVFKKKEKVKVDLDTDKAKEKTIEKPKERKRTKSVLGGILKADKKEKKQIKKRVRKKEKERIKEEKKRFKEEEKLEKDRIKQEKEKFKEQEKLEKEEEKKRIEEEKKRFKEEAKLEKERMKQEQEKFKEQEKLEKEREKKRIEEEKKRFKEEAKLEKERIKQEKEKFKEEERLEKEREKKRIEEEKKRLKEEELTKKQKKDN